MIELQYLDHVAIYVADMDRSVQWYEQVLGLKKQTFEEWGAYPIFMLAGQFGIAIFPATSEIPNLVKAKRGAHINHFAFRVDAANFKAAQERFDRLEVSFQFQDHHYFHSIYINDPDSYIVELTTQVKGF